MRQQLFFLVIFSFVLTGCASVAENAITESNPRRVVGCPLNNPNNSVPPSDQSFNALMATLAYEDWVLERSDQKNGKVRARKCSPGQGDPLKQPVNECLILVFYISTSGEISFFNPAEVRFSYVLEEEVANWVFSLERVFSESRCYSADELQRWSAIKKE